MFFEIKKFKDESFTDSFQLTDTLWLNCDAGWRVFNLPDSRVVIKGYIDSKQINTSVAQSISDKPIPYLTGNFLALIIKNNTVTISHDIHRSTPIRINKQKNIVHNFNCDESEQVWADRIVTIDSQFNLVETFFDPYGSINSDYLSLETVVDRIDSLLTKRYRDFFKHNTLPVKWFPSGGIDSLTTLVYLNKLGINYEMCFYEYFDYTKFICTHKTNIQSNWAYKQIHHWNNPCILVTGSSGDESFLRGPETTNILCLYHGIDIEQLIQPTDYHYHYHLQDKFIDLYNRQRNSDQVKSLISDKDKMNQMILNMNLHDHQHWHLENTITFTPLKDLEITKLILRLKPEELVKQLKDAIINRMLIERNDSSVISGLSKYKNINEKENIWKLLK